MADEPAVAYRALLIDCARQWHPPQVIKDVIVMCRLYKINFLQLHLTDDPLFTFPSKAFPSLPTVEKGQRRHYTREELLDLVRFADERGVTIVPELETPGHSAKLRRVEPFGRPGLGCIVMADEKTYEAFDQLIGEMCEVFKSSPYFHMNNDAGVQLPPSQPVLGAQMCAWEQAAENEIPSVRWRLPAMAERIYHPESGQPCADYARRFVHTDGLLDMQGGHLAQSGLQRAVGQSRRGLRSTVLRRGGQGPIPNSSGREVCLSLCRKRRRGLSERQPGDTI